MDHSRLQSWVDKAIGSAITALVIGFFAIIWTTSTKTSEDIRGIKSGAETTRREVIALKEWATLELARLEVQELEARLAALERYQAEQQQALAKLAEALKKGTGPASAAPDLRIPKFEQKTAKPEELRQVVDKFKLDIDKRVETYQRLQVDASQQGIR